MLSGNVDLGRTVATSFQAPVLFSIAEDLKKVEIQVDVDVVDVGKLNEGHQKRSPVRFPLVIGWR